MDCTNHRNWPWDGGIFSRPQHQSALDLRGVSQAGSQDVGHCARCGSELPVSPKRQRIGQDGQDVNHHVRLWVSGSHHSWVNHLPLLILLAQVKRTFGFEIELSCDTVTICDNL